MVVSILAPAILLLGVAATALPTDYGSPALTSKLGPVVDLGYAAFIGDNKSTPGVDFFGGIPYIQPPLGELRWRKPRQLDESYRWPDWRPLHDARNFGPICIQQPAVVGVGVEDCVTLNVWRPSGVNSTASLPVFVYIHGGGNFYNSAQGFPMASWISTTNGNIIAVNIQYRLGLFGFLASSELMKSGSVNVGLLDQRAALDWIQRHIKAFGGDPDRVTISGESSGGASVLAHMLWKGGEAKPPFRAAILQSIGNDPFPVSEVYENCFSNVTSFVGCDEASDVMGCLRSTSAGTLIAAINHRPQPYCKYLPIVDKETIPDIPSRLLQQGKFSKVPVLAGHTTNDGTAFTGSPTSVTDEASLYSALTSSRYTRLTNATFHRALTHYNLSDFSSFYEMAQELVGDTQFKCWDWFVANKTLEAGVPAFNYRWNTPDPVAVAANPYRGVLHTSDLYYLFDGTNSGVSSIAAQNVFHAFNATEKPLNLEAVSYWTSFARASNPSTFKYSTSPSWPSLNETLSRLVIQEGASNTSTASVVEVTPQKHIERCLFWISVNNETRV
ncbi:alpha/beta-hydrolase [Gonapodya prolifera JEL478]|uniref:Carboxylic ester hydrolase n=1 Tax=Gonapodya prolifera (strain JEL478) TaxID=1344416 RepID=A0A139A5K8_GONPJ|nr:alpha/beta-hydrolase [Gonapodya prolifera JEL478]|eukprot:KXS11919.1 alpha/beta-hydrolase [Gonapodya prolifera JEL478]